MPHALVALETGVVTTESLERWDSQKYERQRDWNRDHTVISALRPSVLWVFQRVAPRIGAERMAEWLSTFEYGNRDVSGPITEYLINGTLQIAVPEQVGVPAPLLSRPAASRAALLARGSRRSPAGGRDGRELARRPSDCVATGSMRH